MTERTRSLWCTEGKHLDCAASEAACQCSCHGATRRRPTEARTGFGKPGGTTAQRQPQERPQRAPRARKPLYAPDHPAPQPRPRVRTVTRPTIRKEDAPCCVALRDPLGRLPVGYCSPGCIRRPVVTVS